MDQQARRQSAPPDMAEILKGRRMRRLRRTDWSRRLVRENTLTVDDLIWPIFITEGTGVREPVPSMPGVVRHSVDEAAAAAEEAASLKIPAIALFPYSGPDKRDETGSEALNADNLVCRACRAIASAAPTVGIMTDVALDPYTSHGHDGLMADGEILNDETISQLIGQALVQAEAGCDIIAPSDMMDGRIGAIRAALDAEAERLRAVMDEIGCVNVFLSEGAGVADIVEAMEAAGTEVPRDPFGHVMLKRRLQYPTESFAQRVVSFDRMKNGRELVHPGFGNRRFN